MSSGLAIETPAGITEDDLKDLRQRERQILLAASIEEQDKGALIVRAHKGTPFYEVKWRDFSGTQRKRRLGRAWLMRNGEDEWAPRPGRRGSGFIDERRAYALMPKVILAHEQELMKATPASRAAGFEDVAAAWLEYLVKEKRIKPSTLSAYRSLLTEPTGKRKARIMRAFGGRRIFAIRTKDVREFLSKLDDEEISARTVNIHRQVLHSIFEFARREETFGLPSNPVAATSKRPEDGSKPIETFEPEEIEEIAAAAAKGLHRRKGGYKNSRYSERFEREWRRINRQDACLFTIAAFTGLRLGELIALRWRDVDLESGILTVWRAMSDGQETSTKSRKSRTVPIAEQAEAAFRQLLGRGKFLGREDFVFCRADGGPLDRSAIRARFIRAQKKAGVRVRRFHDLRHTFGSLAIRRLDLVSVKKLMGHAKLSTTERYLHSKPRATDAANLTAAFAGESGSAEFALMA